MRINTHQMQPLRWRSKPFEVDCLPQRIPSAEWPTRQIDTDDGRLGGGGHRQQHQGTPFTSADLEHCPRFPTRDTLDERVDLGTDLPGWKGGTVGEIGPLTDGAMLAELADAVLEPEEKIGELMDTVPSSHSLILALEALQKFSSFPSRAPTGTSGGPGEAVRCLQLP